MRRLSRGFMLCCAVAVPLAAFADQPQIHVESPHLQGPLPLAAQTQSAAIRDYLQSWQALQAAFDQNQSGLLDPDFVGTAHDKLAATIAEQAKLGIHTRYQDRAHNVQIVFYSPDGLSIQLLDTVEYDQQVMKGGAVLTSQQVRRRYVVVLTPTQVRWAVRIFQEEPE